MREKFYIQRRSLDNMFNKKKSLVLLIGLCLVLNVFLISGGNFASPLIIQGFVEDSVLNEVIGDSNLEVVVQTSGGVKAIASTKATEPSGNHAEGHYDIGLYAFPGEKVTVTASIKGTNCYGSATGVVPGGSETGLLNINVGICCRPSKASSFNPSGAHHITQPTDVEFSWNSGTKGKSSYPALWEDFKGPENKLDVESPFTLKVKGLNSWSIKTCNGVKGGESCCVEAGVGGGLKNGPCPIPTNLKSVVDGGYVIATWDSSAVDSEGDSCHDVWEAMSLAQGDVMENASWRGSSDPADKSGELAIAQLVTFWKVKSCDEFGACSAYAEMITPSCNVVSSDCPDLNTAKSYVSQGRGKGNINLKVEGVGEGNIFGGNFFEEEKPFTKKSFWFLLVLRLGIILGVIYYEYRRKKKLR